MIHATKLHRLLGAALLALAPHLAQAETAYFAGGCFWCVEADFEKVRGVGDVVSGFTGGRTPDPVYGRSGDHIEAAEIPFDEGAVSYAQLVHAFFRSVDPTDGEGQFCDRGPEYRTAIFPVTDAQRRVAEAAKAEAEAALGQPIATQIIPFGRFYPVDAYHQGYYKSEERLNRLSSVGLNPKKRDAYEIYRSRCGRDARVRQLWGAEAWAAR